MGARNSKVKKGDKEGEIGDTESAEDTTRQYGTLPASAKVGGNQTDEEVLTPEGGGISKSGTLPANLNRSTSFTHKFRSSAKAWAKDKGILKEKPEPTDDVTETDTGVTSHESSPVKETKQNGIENQNGNEEKKEAKAPEDPSRSTKLSAKKARARFFEDMYNTPEKPKRLDLNSLGNNSIVTSTPITDNPANKVQALIKQVEENESRHSSLSYDVNIKTPTPDIKHSFDFEEETSATSNIESTNVSIISNTNQIVTNVNESQNHMKSEVISSMKSETVEAESRQKTELTTSSTTQEAMSVKESKIENNVTEITSQLQSQEISVKSETAQTKLETATSNFIKSEKISEICETSEVSEKNDMEMVNKGEESVTVCQSSPFSQVGEIKREEISESIKSEAMEVIQSYSGREETIHQEIKHEEVNESMKIEAAEMIQNNVDRGEMIHHEVKHTETSEVIKKESSEMIQHNLGSEEIKHQESSEMREVVQCSTIQDIGKNRIIEETQNREIEEIVESSTMVNCADESNLKEEVDDESSEAANTGAAADIGISCGNNDEASQPQKNQPESRDDSSDEDVDKARSENLEESLKESEDSEKVNEILSEALPDNA